MVAGHWPFSLSAHPSQPQVILTACIDDPRGGADMLYPSVHHCVTRASFSKNAMCRVRFEAGCSIQNILFRVSELLTRPVREYIDINELID